MTALDYGQDRVADLSLQKPIFFVVHSMGGLVVKKAYTMGKHDAQYSGLVSRIKAILFLATPHRGSRYAKILNNILSTTPLATSSKAYVAGLDKQSDAIQDINEAFRQHCDGLSLCSFYETLRTNLGFKRVMVSKALTKANTRREPPISVRSKDAKMPSYRSWKNLRPSWGIPRKFRLAWTPITTPFVNTGTDRIRTFEESGVS